MFDPIRKTVSDSGVTCEYGPEPIGRDSAEVLSALMRVPPGCTLAGEYLRQRRVIEEQQAQIVRAIELRVVADQRAGKRNVRALEERIDALTNQRDILIEALKAAPWGSCRNLSEAVGTALNDNEASDENGIELENEIGVWLGPDGTRRGA